MQKNKIKDMYLSELFFGKSIKRSSKQQFKNCMHLEIFAIDLLLEANSNIQNKCYALFDPSVGDQWCEARASLLLEKTESIHAESNQLLLETDYLLECKNQLQQLLTEFERLEHNSGGKESHFLFKIIKKDLHVLLRKYGIRPINLSQHLKYLTICFFIKKYYPLYRENERQQFKLIILKYGISASTVKSIIKYARKYVNSVTDSYLLMLSNRIMKFINSKKYSHSSLHNEYSNYKTLLERFEEKNGIRKRAVFPGIKMILANIWLQNIPIILNARVITAEQVYTNFKLLYVPDSEMPFKFNWTPLKEEIVSKLLSRPTFTVEGVGCVTEDLSTIHSSVDLSLKLDAMQYDPSPNNKRVKQIEEQCIQLGIEKLLEYSTVTHPQYLEDDSQLDLNVLQENKTAFSDQYHQLKTEANQLGCCAKKMTTMRVYHIFPDLLKNVIKRQTSTIWHWQKINAGRFSEMRKIEQLLQTLPF